MMQALVPIDRESEPECMEGGFIKRAVLHVFAWLRTLSLLETLSLAGSLVVGLFSCYQAQKYVRSDAEVWCNVPRQHL